MPDKPRLVNLQPILENLGQRIEEAKQPIKAGAGLREAIKRQVTLEVLVKLQVDLLAHELIPA